ncbi:DUF1553 domain-containing protein [Rhodopirellula sp. JC639]|uniref:DUF1553 domain-containing protein n=1 Tax=Stieleria mannarensis TaxID=2755585 RepID=UPI0015FEF3F1|nr:DUF1553 domain-containing protein [Rhodopirellula sp. JC639]
MRKRTPWSPLSNLTALVIASCAITLCLIGPAVTGAAEPGSESFFEQKIRPVLIKHCYQCHSADSDEIGGSLWLDSAGAMREGGDSGPAIRPGDADASLLISAIRYESSEMPPDAPLPPAVVDDFVQWIDAGAIDPRKQSPGDSARPATIEIDLEQGRKFWAFRPLADFRRGLSEDSLESVRQNLIDHGLDDQLSEHGIRPVGPAPPETRLRRLAFDLTGLPPSDAVSQRWMASPNEQTWKQIVDELLASRAFAQHWARHWMDVARYADSNGSDFNATFHEAWRYRDYLIDSFDRDRPLDEMIRQQVAGDLLPAATDQQRHDNVVATTFLMLGPKMLSERAKQKLTLDVVDEQIDTIGRAFLGMTLGCARCHDHKFDPIPTEDYYALAGIFRSTQTLNGESQKYVSTWNRVELPTTDDHRRSLAEHRSTIASLEKQIKEATQELQAARRSGNNGIIVDDSEATKVGDWTASTYTKGFIGAGYVHDDNANKGKLSIEFRKQLPQDGEYVVRFAYSSNGNRAATVPVTIATADGDEQLIVSQRKSSDTPPWNVLGTFTFSADKDAVVTIRNDDTDGYVIADAIAFLPVEQAAEPGESRQVAERIADAQKRLDDLKQQLDATKKNAPPPLPVAMAPRDLPTDQIADSPVHIRGEVNNVGEVVPRGFLQVCGPGDASIDSPTGSGRVELAKWLTDPDNPLVARVMVNRVWMHLMGEGIVRTVDNFGTRGERPSHPQLLDALAIDFMRQGWQLKSLVRRIVLSEAYNRSSEFDDQAAASDPENRLLWRAHRKRLTAESIRDTMLKAAGVLTEEERTEPVADKGVLVTKNNAVTKDVASGLDQPVRSIYLPVIRSNVPPLMTALDAADPDLLVGKRPTTNVPGQALVLINSAEVTGWAQQTADRIYRSESTWQERLRAAYRICLSRQPSPEDMQMAEHYIGLNESDDDATTRERFADFVAAIFATTEFRMLD